MTLSTTTPASVVVARFDLGFGHPAGQVDPSMVFALEHQALAVHSYPGDIATDRCVRQGPAFDAVVVEYLGEVSGDERFEGGAGRLSRRLYYAA